MPSRSSHRNPGNSWHPQGHPALRPNHCRPHRTKKHRRRSTHGTPRSLDRCRSRFGLPSVPTRDTHTPLAAPARTLARRSWTRPNLLRRPDLCWRSKQQTESSRDRKRVTSGLHGQAPPERRSRSEGSTKASVRLHEVSDGDRHNGFCGCRRSAVAVLRREWPASPAGRHCVGEMDQSSLPTAPPKLFGKKQIEAGRLP
jgi:hypothetical protein